MSKFQPGNSLSKGRPKGSRNKVKLLGIREALAEAGIHPVAQLMALLPKLDPALQARVWLELMPYTFSKPTAEPDDLNEFRKSLTPEQTIELQNRLDEPHVNTWPGLPESTIRAYRAEIEESIGIVVEEEDTPQGQVELVFRRKEETEE